MVIRLSQLYDCEHLDKIIERLEWDVKIVKSEANLVEFESNQLLFHFRIDKLFTLVDYGRILKKGNKVIYEIVSIQFWFAIAFMFILGWVVMQQLLVAATITTIIGILTYIAIYLRHWTYLRYSLLNSNKD